MTNFTVSVDERQGHFAIINWTQSIDLYRSDSIKYDIVLNGRTVKQGLTQLRDTLRNLVSDSFYSGLVIARSSSGDSLSAPFELKKLKGFLYLIKDDRALYCLELYSHQLIWKYPATTGADFNGIPLVSNNIVYVPVRGGYLQALNALTGEPIWRTAMDYIADDLSAPILKNGKVIVGTNNGTYALNATTGAIEWSFKNDKFPPICNPVAGDNYIFVAVNDGTSNFPPFQPPKMLALDVKDGSQKWQFPLPPSEIISKSPTVINGLLIFTSDKGIIYALNQANGSVAWQLDISQGSNRCALKSPLAYKGLVVVWANMTGYLGINATTGKIVWSIPNSNFSYDVSAACLGDSAAYYVDYADNSLMSVTSKLVAFNPLNGTVKYRSNCSGISYSPLCVKQTVYLQNSNEIGIHTASSGTFTGTVPWSFGVGRITISEDDSVYYAPESGMSR